MPVSQNKSFIINVDDLGVDYGGTEAFRQLINTGSVNSGSVMLPCPWFEQVKDLYKQNHIEDPEIHLPPFYDRTKLAELFSKYKIC